MEQLHRLPADLTFKVWEYSKSRLIPSDFALRAWQSKLGLFTSATCGRIKTPIDAIIYNEAIMKARSDIKVVGKRAKLREFHPVALLGGNEVLGAKVTTPIEVHELINRGLPRQALLNLFEHSHLLENKEFLEKAVGISVRTSQRHRNELEKPLNQEQSGRTWKYAEILAKSAVLFGSLDAAENWLATPAMGLEQHRPIDLLTTPTGVQLVEEFLTRLEYGVYA